MKWKLREKVLVLSTLIALIPFVTTNIYWYFNAQSTVRENAKSTITLATSQAADKVNDFLNTKLIGFLSHSQNAALLNGDTDIIQEDLLHLLLQDPDLQRVSFVDTEGQERVKIDKKHVYTESELDNVSDTDAFKLASYQYGKEYISPVSFETTPELTIAVPVAYPETAQSLKTFSSGTNSPRSIDEIRGVLISTITLGQLTDKLLSLKVGPSGYVYLSDKDGKLITYHNKQVIGSTFVTSRSDTSGLAASKIGLDSPTPPINQTSIEGIPVMSTQQKIARTNWTIVTEMPLATISDDITDIQKQALLLSLLPLAAILLISLYFARTLINPIRLMATGAQAIAQGNFNYSFATIKTGDELEQLADAYTNMSKKIEFEQSSLISEKTTLETILGSVADGVIALDHDLQVIFSNHAATQILGIPENVMTGKTLDSFIIFSENEDHVTIASLINESSGNQKSHKLTFSIDANQSKTISLILLSVPVSAFSNISYLLTFYDVSKEQEFENMKLDFVSMAAHELRTPLTAIKGYLSYLDEELANKLNEEEMTYLKRVLISSDQLSSLIENLLNVTKIERGMFKLDLAFFPMEAMIEESLVNLYEVASQKKIQVEFKRPGKSFPDVLGDKFRVSQVFTNLVSNAINYTQVGGHVEITMERGEDGVIVHVADNGQGIPAASLPHLFTKFYRVGGALEQGSKGTGLGLFISKSIIERHNGKIWVESIEGKGSTFSFQLPVQAAVSHE